MVIFLIMTVIEKNVDEHLRLLMVELRTQNVMTLSEAYFFPNKRENLGSLVQWFWH